MIKECGEYNLKVVPASIETDCEPFHRSVREVPNGTISYMVSERYTSLSLDS